MSAHAVTKDSPRSVPENRLLKALYFPHTDIDNPVIMKNALLLWDEIETIVPTQMWRPQYGSANRNRRRPSHSVSEAAEIVVKRRVPDVDEQRRADGILREFLADGFLNRLAKQASGSYLGGDYAIHPEKFLQRTWELLCDRGLARWIQAETDFGVPAAVGLLMMSVLADVCAGSLLQKVTDRTEAYAWLAQQRASALGSQYVTNLDVSQVAPEMDRLAIIAPEIIDARRIPVEKLIALRKREAKSNGADYRAMRHRFAAAIETHVKRIGAEATRASDVRELNRQFKEELKADIQDLKKELQLASIKTLFSKEVGLSVVLVAGTLVSPITGLTELATQVGGLGIIPLLKAHVDYRAARRDALKKHTMSWLYLASKGPATLY